MPILPDRDQCADEDRKSNDKEDNGKERLVWFYS